MLSARFIETATSPEGIMLISISVLGTTIIGICALYLIDWLERRAMMRRKAASTRKPIPAVEVYGRPIIISHREMRDAVAESFRGPRHASR